MLTYYSLRIGLVLAAVIPHRLAYLICSIVGNVAFYCNGSARRAVQDNMRHVFGPRMSRWRLNQACRYVFRNTVKNYYDMLSLPKMKQTDVEKRVTVDGAEHIDEALKRGHGAIIFSGHIGNYNLVAQAATARGYPTNIIAEQLHPPKLHELENGLRSKFGLKMIPLGPGAVRGLYQALRGNEILVLAADRDLTANGVPVEFFGEVTELPSGLAAISMRLNAPLIPIHAVRKANDSTVVTVYPPIELERTGDRERDTLVGTQQIARVVEDMIRRTPEQWVVLQKVWPDPNPYLTAPTPALAAAPPAITPDPDPQLTRT